MMEEQKRQQQPLQGKIVLSGILQVLTGMHIGGSIDFAPIGAVDSPFIRDPFSHAPIIPGSSLKESSELCWQRYIVMVMF